MTGPICHHCGGYLQALDDHDERQCEIDQRQETYRRGRALVQTELDAAKAALAATRSEEPTP